MFYFLLTFIALTIYTLIYWLKNVVIDTMKYKIRGPIPIPVLGNGHIFLSNTAESLKVMTKLGEEYNDAVRVYILSDRYVLLSHPKYVESVLSSSELITKGRSYDFLVPWLGRGLLTSTGMRWRTHRKFLTPAFHFNILQSFLPVFIKNQRILNKKLKKMADGTPINLFPVIALAALDNVTEALMGGSAHAQMNSESEYVKAVEEISIIAMMRIRQFFVAVDAIFNLLPYKKRQDKALEILHGHSRKAIDARHEELKNSSNIRTASDVSEFGTKNKTAFLDLLLLSEINGKKIDMEHIREEVDTFMFEAHDTTTSAITFALYCISRHKDVQTKIYDEQKLIFGNDLEREPTHSELQQMKYLELVIKETLRLYPSVPLIGRLITRDTDVADIRLSKGTSLIINIFRIHRHPDLFDNPLEFNPERFKANLKNPYSWIAFSAGPRNCIGQKFAMMEIKVVLSDIIRQFSIHPSGDTEPELFADLILRAHQGIYVKLKPRFE